RAAAHGAVHRRGAGRGRRGRGVGPGGHAGGQLHRGAAAAARRKIRRGARAARRSRLHIPARSLPMTSYMSEAEVNARALSEGPAEPTPAVFIMGAGVVGTALA